MISGSRPAVARLAMMAWIAAVALTGSCGRKPHTSTASPPPVLGSDHRFAIKVGDQIVNMRLAVHESEQARGLMNVPSMPANEGMLFVYAQPKLMSFYMRNCVFPQTIGFFDAEGVLRETYPMYPGVEDSVQSRSDQMKLALEMNLGWFAQHQVLPGATIDLTAVRAALKQRGYNPDQFFPAK